MARHLQDWLRAYLDFTDNQESPENLHFWVGLSVLSAALQRHIYLDRVWYKLYPNIYVLVVAESAKIRKSVAIDLGLGLLKDAIPTIQILSGRMTPEGMGKYLNRQTVTIDGDGRQLHRADSHALIHADELATLFGYEKQGASRMAILLTELYSSKDHYAHITIREGVIDIYNIYITLLAATAPQNFRVMPEEAVGGLLGRLILVAARQKRRSIAWAEDDVKAIEARGELRKKLIADLTHISTLSGLFVVTPEARDLFRDWYEKQEQIVYEDPRLDAFHERCHDTALKLAMLIALARSDELVLQTHHIKAGITAIETLMPEYTRIMTWAGTSDYAQNRARFLDILRRSGGTATRSHLLRTLAIPVTDFDTIVASLREEGSIENRSISEGRDLVYRLVT